MIPTIDKLVAEKGSAMLKLVEINYLPSRDLIEFTLSYENCSAPTEEGFCDGLYSAYAYRLRAPEAR